MSSAESTVTPLPSNKPTARVEHVTPAVARRWLEHNTRNRHIRPARVARYARDMAAGRWEMTGEAVKFGADGSLLDGQHRLRAVVDADVTVPMLVVRGVAETAQSVMDTGAARRASDALTLHGKPHGHTLAAAARLGVTIDGSRTRTNDNSISNPEVFAWIEEHPEIETAVERVHCGELKNHIAVSVSTLAYAYYRTAIVDYDAAEEFFISLATRANLPLGSPILTLANRLDKIARERQKLPQMPALWLLFRAWNGWRAGESLNRLLLPESIDTLPTPK